ncbi:MAG: hypothetical protein D6722_14645 [Bacteroidetes bacterium]|nr:MAG: hypothetical protein D6722_14645 [Bacteroidota bacterium]
MEHGDLILTERIEAYLDGELSQEARVHFEQEVAADEALAAEVQLHRDTRQLLRLQSYRHYKAQLQALDAETPVRRLVVSRRNFLWSAAAVLLLLVIGSYLWVSISYRHEALAQQAFSPYRDITVLRGEYPGRDSLLATAMAAYGAGDYALAVGQFESVLDMSPDYAVAQLYMGISLLGIGEAARSQNWLRKAMASERLSEVAGWYLGLALVQAGNLDEARAHLEALSQDPAHSYGDQAQALLAKLNSPLRRLPGVR